MNSKCDNDALDNTNDVNDIQNIRKLDNLCDWV